ncbi:MAG: type II toxin-antitoxin system RelE/ParE family toxin [Patescibacteria group bacterium]
MYKVIYTSKARKDLKNLDLKITKRIIKKIKEYQETPDPLSFAKHLKNSILGSYRFRIGDYRAIFDVDRDGNITILLILKIAHRKDIYNDT